MTTVREITVDQLAAVRQDTDPPLVLDVRGRSEYATGHVPGARNIPLDELPDRLDELRGSRRVAAICRSGRRSIEAAETLVAAGIDAVSVAGGTHAWTAAGRPTRVG
ncbi:rhodanese-like domain-containing protein [Actinomycetospora lutea]|uniref:rhodanese-like domain-containing protein n=1 Tax=Actinomycetospora lutea TaxID=663604 RepID=UPI0023671E6F|nr:rhodanese-like domain-containing protein [Actinomycetospora lutea]MDD7939603.1 rhodanese-like domain-containing protein [Actinomycetospora lutea]